MRSSDSRLVRSTKWLALCFVASTLVHPDDAFAQAAGPPTFYNLSSDPDSLQLLDLQSITGSGADTSAVTVDLFRGGQKIGLRSLWAIDCTQGRMTITASAQLGPGWEGKPAAVKTDSLTSASSTKAATMIGLACDGSGDLAASRTYRSDLATIITRFWR